MSEKIARYLDSLKYGWRKIPPSLQIGITDHCFNKCIMCGHWQRPNKSVLAWHDLMPFLAQAKGKGLESVCYSGGDPFTYYAINDVMEWHMNNDIKFGFITGGYVPSSIDMSLLKCAQWVRVSLDAIGCDAYANIRGGVLFSEVDNSIKSMIRYGVNVELGITITDISDLRSIFEYAIDNNVKAVSAKPIRGPKSIGTMLNIDDDLLMAYRGKFDAAGIEHNLQSNYDVHQIITHCYACQYQWFIAANGSVYPCCLVAGDTEQGDNLPPLGTIWDKGIWEKALEFSKAPLTLYCKQSCMLQRLVDINIQVEAGLNNKHFF